MKNAMISLALFVASLSANATSLHPDTFVQAARLTDIRMDKGYTDTVVAAQIQVNMVTKVARLTLKHPTICGSARVGQPACLGFRSDTVIEVPIVSSHIDTCGSRVITARKNMMPVDGPLVQLVIKDNRTMTCKTFVAVPGTEVYYKMQFYNRFQGGLITQESVLTGESLRSPLAR
jgi:hypothetical protein